MPGHHNPPRGCIFRAGVGSFGFGTAYHSHEKRPGTLKRERPVSSPAAEFENVSKVYAGGVLRRRPLPAVRDVRLRVEPGEVLGLLGPNRAGKTTLVKVLLSLCRPTAGTV